MCVQTDFRGEMQKSKQQWTFQVNFSHKLSWRKITILSGSDITTTSSEDMRREIFWMQMSKY